MLHAGAALMDSGCAAEEVEGPYRKRPAHVVDEPEPERVPLEERFPGANIYPHVKPPAPALVLTPRLRNPGAPTAACDRPELDLCGVKAGDALVVVTGPTGSGKTSALRQLVPGWDPSSAVEWDPTKAVVSQFGTPEEGSQWLGRVGLNSIPAWACPRHALSTGQGYRADLARKLQQCYARGCELVLDDFGCYLDLQSAACCAVSLSKSLRRLGSVRAVLSCRQSEIVNWLQPDVLVVLHNGGAQVLRNPSPGAVAQLTLSEELMASEIDAEWTPLETRPFADLRDLRVKEEWMPDESSTDFTGRVVLAARVTPDAATDMCDSFFDTATHNEISFVLPMFPAGLCGSDFGVGLVCGPSGSGDPLATSPDPHPYTSPSPSANPEPNPHTHRYTSEITNTDPHTNANPNLSLVLLLLAAHR